MHLREFPGPCRPSSLGVLQDFEQENSEVKGCALGNSVWWLDADGFAKRGVMVRTRRREPRRGFRVRQA